MRPRPFKDGLEKTMPSKSKAQRNLMAAAAHNPAFAKKVGIPTSVAKEFNAADKGKKFGAGGKISNRDKLNNPKVNHGNTKYFKEGGSMKHSDVKMDKKVVKKAVKMHDEQLHGGKKTDLKTLKKGGMACKGYAKGGGIEIKGKTKGKIVKMCSGGMSKGKK